MYNCCDDDECKYDKDNEIYRGEDTDAFGQNFLTINATIPEGWVISKAEVVIENLLPIIINSPTFPLHVNLSRTQTNQLHKTNKVRLNIYDTLGRKKICDGYIVIKTKC